MISVTLRAAVINTTASTLRRYQIISLRLSSSYGIASSTIPKNMTLRHCSPTQTTKMSNDTVVTQMSPSETPVIYTRTLVIIMEWMSAKDKHVDKFNEMWLKRGCDVLTVRTSPLHVLLPVIGVKSAVNNLANYLLQINPQQYRQIVIHAFSSGNFKFGLLLHKLRSADQYNTIGQSIRGVICDSFVDKREIAVGMSRVYATNPILQRLLHQSIHVFLKLFSAKFYERISHEFYDMYLRCPALVLYSEADILSNANTIRKLISAWNELGMCVQSKCWHSSPHVSHYREHPLEYEQQIDAFLKLINLHDSDADVVV